ncbi:U1biquitin-specific peptidase-like protein [Bisporella sp. PMI_857]|nr:U1biquitin-specific peptidase-like protein [Bisporella sp. PMI_857]
MSTQCAFCGKTSIKLLKCGRCTSCSYCGPQCQKKDWPTHKVKCKRQNYILRVDLHPRFIINPRITRTLSCPATATFAEFHEALLVAFGWANTHIYDFDVFDHSDTSGRENSFSWGEPIFKITDISTVEDCCGFGPPYRDSSKVTLFKILDDPKTKGKTIHYNYDLGDGWEHVISCTGRTDATAPFVCLEGEGHGCAEDVGGHIGWKELLEAYDSQNPTKAQKEDMTWFEQRASNKDPEGLRGELKWKWDRDRINQVLAELNVPSGATTTLPTFSHSVLLISLDKQPFFDDMYSQVMAKLRSKADVTEVTHIASAMKHLLAAHQFAAVIVTDPEVMDNGFVAVQEKLVDYARAGGTVIFGFHCSSFVRPNDLARFFKETWSVNWQSGAYTRSMLSLNHRANPVFMSRRGPNLPQQFSMKALHLIGTRAEDRIYISSPGSTESPAVFAKYGDGNLGWIGDVNTEDGTTELILTMCGV